MDRGARWAAVYGVAQSWTRLKRFSMHALEKKMATHSSILAWRIPGTEGPGGLPSMGLQSRHDCRDLAAMLSWGEKWCLWVGSHLWMCSCAWQCLEAWGISHKNSLFLYSEKMRLSGHPASTFFYDGCALDLGCGLCPFYMVCHSPTLLILQEPGCPLKTFGLRALI